MVLLSDKQNASSSTFPDPFISARSKAPDRQAIALISDHGDPAADIGKEAAGGQNVYVRQVGEALAKLGWQVDMFTRKTRADDATIVQHSPHCRTIRLTAGPTEFIPRDRLFEFMPAFVNAFQKYQAKHHYPLIHTNYWMSAWVGLEVQKTHNVQLVNTYHSLGAIKYQAVPNRPAIANTRLDVEQQILEQANCIVATSPQEQEALRSLVSSQGHIEVIPCGTDIENFHVMPKSEARSQLGFQPDEKIVLYVGRFDPRKGIETLVRACTQLKENPADVRLVIVGGSDSTQADGDERNRIEGIVQELGLSKRTTFVGRVGHDRLPLYYTAADVCVIPSHYEPFGLVAIESMACGTPVVASAVGGLKFSIVPEETGLLVPPQDTDAFAEAIDRILGDDLWATKLRLRASERVQQNFSWSGVAAQLSDLYRRLLAQSIAHEMLVPVRSSDLSGAIVVPAKALTQVS
ncbi:glycosyltransferase family 1 protein [Phormidesmis priestleyi ULC007]|uniref:Glycosyltransferase family 1 protein n=1 Tax=Phormidesmis priestleyi ULC007 TaxID=1920490 RepID=A0A2T1D4A7_9CYAN|nr:glycosyltransferase family 1 protein [Phormidesmis priestleyi]PSB15355.1 glycosyltransferase family 1 protein [Phormidesmis priestleyi ULC007]PZO51594.1 MAG: glycosyltransferase family 1 protein [Phormidesmis priestleyi]